MTNYKRVQALKAVCAAISGHTTLSSTDFADVEAWLTPRPFSQGSGGGITIQFSISHHAIGKIPPGEWRDGLKALLDAPSPVP